MSAEAITATRLAKRGMALVGRVLGLYEAMADEAEKHDELAKTQLLGHMRNITDAIVACTKVQAEEREQLEFEQEHKLGDLRELILQYLASLKPAELTSLVAQAQAGAPKTEVHA